MPERPGPRRTRVIVTWDGVRYSYRTLDENGRPVPDAAPSLSRFPLIEATGRGAAARSGGAMIARADPDPAVGAGPADPTRAPGLYDLPTLLARIWSVPAAQQAGRRATPSGGSGPREASPTSPVPDDRPDGAAPAFTVAEWTMPTPPSDLSLPLAAVPSLTIGAPPLAERAPPEPRRETESGPSYVPTVQYIAWRRPPCRLPYDLPRPHDRSNVRGLAGEVTARPYEGPHSGWARRNLWMRLASPGSAAERYDGSVAADV